MNTFSPSRPSLLGLLLLVLLAGCELEMPIDPLDFDDIEDIRYTEHIQPFIFDLHCTSCHVGADAPAGLSLDSWDNLVEGSDHGEAVIPFDDDNSLMVKMVTRLVEGPHPAEVGAAADTLNEAEIRFLSRWIREGARFDGPAETINAGEIPYQNSQNLLFVPNEQDALISVIDTDAKLVIRTIDLQNDTGFNFSPNARPRDVEAEEDGKTSY